MKFNVSSMKALFKNNGQEEQKEEKVLQCIQEKLKVWKLMN